jgi:hypothetical protein
MALMYRNLSLSCILLAICFSACKQVAYKAPPPATAASFLPQTYGSVWVYRDSVFGEAGDTVPIYGPQVDTLTYTINGSTTDFNSLVCYNVSIVSRLRGASTAYYYAVNHLYAVFDTSPPVGFMIKQILIDTGKVGYTWISTPDLYSFYMGNPIRSINTIEAKDTTHVVNGVLYNNVIHTSSNFQINVKNTGYKNVAYFDFYLVRGIGIIEKDAYYYGMLNEKQTMLNCSIK